MSDSATSEKSVGHLFYGNDIANGTESACKASTTQLRAEPWEMERHKKKLRPTGAESLNVS